MINFLRPDQQSYELCKCNGYPSAQIPTIPDSQKADSPQPEHSVVSVARVEYPSRDAVLPVTVAEPEQCETSPFPGKLL